MDRLARDLDGHLQVLRLPAQSSAGRALAPRWRLRVTPTFVLFDGAGQELARGPQLLNPGEVGRLIGQP